MEKATLIRDFAILLGSAGIAGVVFHLLRLPLLLGYILSGLIIGPHLWFSSYISNYDALHQLGELGVIFLMFYVGLEFNLEKLRKAIGPSIVAVVLQVVFMTTIGILLAKFLGWSGLNGLFLGSLMSISSTMVTIPLLKDLKLFDTHPAQLSMGILILEDLVTIIILIVLSSMASTGTLDWGALVRTGFFVGAFVSMTFVIGRLMGSKMAVLLNKFSSAELIAVVASGFVLVFGELSNKVNFSIELGAFLAGSVLSQSVIAHQVEKITEPLRDVFCAMFFVSIGMMIEPGAILNHWGTILVVSVISLCAQVTLCTVGLMLSGENSKDAFRGGLYKAQIGEFSFIIASLGLSLGVVEKSLMSIAVGMAVCTIIGCSITTKNADRLYNFFGRLMPKALVNFAEFYYKLIHVAKMELNKNRVWKECKIHLGKIVIYFLLLVGMMVLSSYVSWTILTSDIKWIDKSEKWWILGVWCCSAFIIAPTFIGVLKNIDAIISKVMDSTLSDIDAISQSSGATTKLVKHVVVSVVTLVFGMIFIALSSQFFPKGYALSAFLILSGIQLLFFRKRLADSNVRMERLFQETFIAEVHEKDEEFRNVMLQKIKEKYPWNILIKNYTLPKTSLYVGSRISDVKIRQRTGTTIVAISRGGYTSYSPMPDTVLFPEDKMLLLGEQEQLDNAIKILDEEDPDAVTENQRVEFAIDNYCITAANPMIGKTIAETGIRSKYGVNIIGIQRNMQKIVTPKASMILEKGDVLLLTGPRQAINNLQESELTVAV